MDVGATEEARSHHRKALWKMVILISCTSLILVALCWPIGGNSKESARRTANLSNLKQIAVALNMYTADNDDRFPPDVSSVAAVHGLLTTYLQPEVRMVSNNKGSSAFLGNGSLAGKKGAVIAIPDLTLVFFDSAPWPEVKRAVTFVDSHVKFLKEEMFQEAVGNRWVLPEVAQR